MTAPEMTTVRPEHGGNGGAPGSNIDQIRDIIFGTQLKDYDRRFTQLEERLLKDSADLREELSRRYNALEQYIKREIEALGDRLMAEQRSRTTALQEMGDEAARSTRELRADLSRQAATLSEDIQRRSTELSGSLKRESDELHTRKVDRAALGAMFADVASRLADEFRKGE